MTTAPSSPSSYAAAAAAVVVADWADYADDADNAAVLQPPTAPQEPYSLTAHGDTRVDEYYWLRDDDRKSRRVLAHLAAENAYTAAALADTEALQEDLYKEMRRRIQEADVSVAVR
jgi:oligopeptidase B